MDSQQHRDAITGELSGWFDSRATQGTPTTGSFNFTEDQIRAVVKNYNDLVDSYDESIRKADVMKVVEGPGREFASEGFANAANRSGDALVDSLTSARNYCMEQARLAQNALDDYLGVEHTNLTEINNQDRHGPQAGI